MIPTSGDAASLDVGTSARGHSPAGEPGTPGAEELCPGETRLLTQPTGPGVGCGGPAEPGAWLKHSPLPPTGPGSVGTPQQLPGAGREEDWGTQTPGRGVRGEGNGTAAMPEGGGRASLGDPGAGGPRAAGRGREGDAGAPGVGGEARRPRTEAARSGGPAGERRGRGKEGGGRRFGTAERCGPEGCVPAALLTVRAERLRLGRTGAGQGRARLGGAAAAPRTLSASGVAPLPAPQRRRGGGPSASSAPPHPQRRSALPGGPRWCGARPRPAPPLSPASGSGVRAGGGGGRGSGRGRRGGAGPALGAG